MISMRLAEEADVDEIYKLSNDKVVREVSFSSSLIPYESHVKWFHDRLHDDNVLFLVFYEENKFVGQIRFLDVAPNEAEISISITEEYRSKGVAGELLERALCFQREKWGKRRINALVKANNIASNKYFIKNNFTLDGSISKNCVKCNVYHREVEG